MGARTIQSLGAELQRRITQLSTTDAEAAINAAIEWLWNKGSYTFQFTGSQTITASTLSSGTGESVGHGTFSPDDVDLGKAMFIANSPQGTPIEKRGMQEFSLSFAINIPADKGFSVYTISGRDLLLRPSQTAQNVGVRYHKKFVPYTAGQTPVTPDDFDEAIIKLAEARERRIYDVGDSWPKVQDEAEKEIMVMLDAYRSISQEPMSGNDAQVAVTERTKLGHA